MRSNPTGPLRHRNKSLRLAMLWVAFGVGAVAALFAVRRLYETVRRELQEQSEIARRQQQAKLIERVGAESDQLRLATIKALVAFHSEGIGYALRRWDEGSAQVIGTFQWEESTGFVPGATFPLELKSEDLPQLWQQFRVWRAGHPKADSADGMMVGPYRMVLAHMIENPLFAIGELGYQAENLEILAHADRPVDPWCGWAGDATNSNVPWIFWYQPGPGAPVRGCFLEVKEIVAKLRNEFADRRLAGLDIVAVNDAAAIAAAGSRKDLADWLPGFAMIANSGTIYVGKQGEARLAAVVVVLLLALFVVGAGFLTIFSRREIRDAERKTTFVTQVSHELRTPLTSIRMFADMLAAAELPEAKRTKFAATISRESVRLGALIERLLMFNTLEQGGSPAVMVPVDAGIVVRETLEEMDATVRGAEMEIQPAIPADPVVVTTDRAALKQSLLNLIDNALKYAREGRLIRVTLERDGGGMRLRVADDGPGIAASLRAQVFEPFVQGGRTLTDKSPGVGLGLSIARTMLRQAGGDLVLLASEKGAVFEIRLPLASAP